MELAFKTNQYVLKLVWQSPRDKRVVTHQDSMPRWIWSISECNLTTQGLRETIGWNPNGIPTRSMENMKWYSPSQLLTAKHVSYPQLTTTKKDNLFCDSVREIGSHPITSRISQHLQWSHTTLTKKIHIIFCINYVVDRNSVHWVNVTCFQMMAEMLLQRVSQSILEKK